MDGGYSVRKFSDYFWGISGAGSCVEMGCFAEGLGGPLRRGEKIGNELKKER